MATHRYDTVNLNRTLTNVAFANVGLGGPFVADRLSPIIPVNILKGTYYVFSNTEAHRDDYDAIRAPKTEANEIERSYSEGTFSIQERALRELISDVEREEADTIIQPEMDSTALLVRKLLLAREQRINTLFFTGANNGNTAGATTHWNNSTGVKIEDDIDTGKLKVHEEAGVVANTIIIPPHIAQVAKRDSTIRELVKYTDSTLLVNGDLPPKLFGLDVIIPTMLIDEANPGVDTASLDSMYDENSVWVGYIERGMPNKKTVSFSYTFRRKINGSVDIGVKKYRDEGRSSTVIEAWHNDTEEVIAADCGYLITGAYS